MLMKWSGADCAHIRVVGRMLAARLVRSLVGPWKPKLAVMGRCSRDCRSDAEVSSWAETKAQALWWRRLLAGSRDRTAWDIRPRCVWRLI